MSESPPDVGFFPLVYDELRRLAAAKLAGEPVGHTLDATALVHEAYLRLGAGAFADRSGFLRAAAVAMQRILVDHARRKRAAKRGGCARPIPARRSESHAPLRPRLRPRHRRRPDQTRRGRCRLGRRGPPPALRRAVDRRGRLGAGTFSRHRLPRMGLRPLVAHRGTRAAGKPRRRSRPRGAGGRESNALIHAAVLRRAEGCEANQTLGSSSSSRPGGVDGSRLRMSWRYAKGSMSWCLQVPVKEYKTAAVRPPRSLPRNVQFRRPSAWARSILSARLLSMLSSPCSG